MKRLLKNLRRFMVVVDSFHCLESAVIEVNSVDELRKIFSWQNKPVLDDPTIYEFDSVLDINERRIRDAESLGTVMCNVNPSVALEIGTGRGHSTALMAINAPQAQVYTLNIPPEEIIAGKGGTLTTFAPNREEIGSYYRELKLKNITQILANSALWEPNIGTIDVAFVDGCHDTEFVYNDTRKILKYMKPGSFILWHDFNLNMVKKYSWIRSVCAGVERLYADGLLKDKIFHIRDSWTGIYKVS